MNNLLLKVSTKHGFTLAGISALITVLTYTATDPKSESHYTAYILVALLWIALLIVVSKAHYKFNSLNGGKMSFVEAIKIGLIIFGIQLVTSFLITLITVNVIVPDRIQLLIENSPYPELLQKRFSVGGIAWSSVASFFIQSIVLFVIILFEAQWKIFTKAGREGWAVFVPVFNVIVMLEIVRKPTWWVILFLIPFVNIIFVIWISNLLSKSFGKDESFTIGMVLLPFIFYPILGFGDATYVANEEMG